MVNQTVSGVQRFWLPKGSPQLPRVDRARGIHIWDSEGNRYIDASSGPVASNLGHSHPDVLAAMRRQSERAAFAFPTIFESQAATDLTRKLAALTGPGLDQAFYVSGGSEAVEMCIKFARSHAVATGKPRKTVVLAREPSYHGNTLGSLSVTGEQYVAPLFEGMLRIMPKVPLPSFYRTPEGMSADDYAQHCIDALEQEIHRQGAENVLAFIMEPVTGLSGGASTAPDFYYNRVREICTENDMLLIYDEVMSGSGRTGRFLGAQNWPDAMPDIVALAKGLGAGYIPLGALVTGEHLLEPVVDGGGFLMGHTSMSAPLSCAVAGAVLDVIVRDGLMENAISMGEHLRSRLRDIQEGSAILGDVRGVGLLNAVEMVIDKDTKQSLPAEIAVNGRIVKAARELGLLIYARPSAGGNGDWLMMAPPLNVTENEVDEICTLFGQALQTVESGLRRNGVLS